MAGVNDAALARARQSWRAAEARLYPLAMTTADGYQRALVLVAAVSEELRAVTTTVDDLLACEPEAARFVASASDATGTSVHGIDPDDVFGSAAAVRDRELAGEEQRIARLSSIERGRAGGSGWVDLHADALGPAVPELRIHVGTGWAVLTALGGDETTGAPVLLVTTVWVDPTTGAVRHEPDGVVRTVGSALDWEQVATELQAAIERRTT
jgi:hypothetical protein